MCDRYNGSLKSSDHFYTVLIDLWRQMKCLKLKEQKEKNASKIKKKKKHKNKINVYGLLNNKTLLIQNHKILLIDALVNAPTLHASLPQDVVEALIRAFW